MGKQMERAEGLGVGYTDASRNVGVTGAGSAEKGYIWGS